MDGLNDGAGVGWFSRIFEEDTQILREECVHGGICCKAQSRYIWNSFGLEEMLDLLSCFLL